MTQTERETFAVYVKIYLSPTVCARYDCFAIILYWINGAETIEPPRGLVRVEIWRGHIHIQSTCASERKRKNTREKKKQNERKKN